MVTSPGSRRRQRGITAVEVALTLPFLLLLLLAVGEVGRALYHYNMLQKAVRGGTRYLAANATPGDAQVISISNAVAAAACNLVVYGQPAAGSTPVLPGLVCDPGADITVPPDATHVRIAIDYTYVPWMLDIPALGMGIGGFTVPTAFHAELTMRVL